MIILTLRMGPLLLRAAGMVNSIRMVVSVMGLSSPGCLVGVDTVKFIPGSGAKVRQAGLSSFASHETDGHGLRVPGGRVYTGPMPVVPLPRTVKAVT